MIYLERKSKFYQHKKLGQSEDSALKEPSVEAVEGYRFRTRDAFTTRPRVSWHKWIVQHVRELTVLISEIGIANTLRYLKYVVSPKAVYVDAVRVKGETKRGAVYYFQKGITLKNSYTEVELSRGQEMRSEIVESDIAQKFTLSVLNSRATALTIRANREKVVSDANSARNWLVVGSGNFASSILIPSIKNSGGSVIACCSNSGVSSHFLSESFDIPFVFYSMEEMISRRLPARNILIATPPAVHADQILLAIEAGLKIYCEKPVAVHASELDRLKEVEKYKNIMIGFNRRYAPVIQSLVNSEAYKENKKRIFVTYVVNLGEFSVSMATKAIGGGTTVGSCCHYLDLIEYICGCKIESFFVRGQADESDGTVSGYSFSCILEMGNESVATLIFKRSLQPSAGVKEFISVVGETLNAYISDFKILNINGRNIKKRLFSKGWKDAMVHFHSVPSLSESPITSTLCTGIRVTELAMQIDAAIENSRI